jgi:hypothetical protein
MHPPSSQIGWLITIGAVQCVWIKVNEERKSKYRDPTNLNQDVPENTLCVIRLPCWSNNNPSVGQFVDFWPKVETTSTACSAARLYKLSCPLREKTLVETDLCFCTMSQLHLIALNVLMTSGVTCTTVRSSSILQCVNIFLFSTVLCIYTFFFALCIDMNNGPVMEYKSTTTLCPEGNTIPRYWIMFDIFIVNTFVDL